MKLRHDLSPVLLFVRVVTAHVYPADRLLGADSVMAAQSVQRTCPASMRILQLFNIEEAQTC
jgi:hypothetical protein